MNFIITSNCNKGCSYCFAAGDRTHDIKSDMSIEQFNKFIDRTHTSNKIKLLGGEPTQHKKIIEFLNILKERNRDVILITNLLFNDEILNFLLDYTKNNRINFLINSTDLDSKGRMKLFSKNYNALYNSAYEFDREEQMSCGITIDNNLSLEYYLNYLDYLRKNLSNIERLRVSISFPGSKEDKGPEKLINNKELGAKVLAVVYKAVSMGITPNIDCIVVPCLFNNKEEEKYIRKFSDNARYKCDGAPTDIFTDETASYCYPLRETVKVEIDKYKNLGQVSEALRIKYNILKANITLPEACKSCIHRELNRCEGPCLGFYDLDE